MIITGDRKYGMEIRTACSPADEKYYDTARLKKEFEMGVINIGGNGVIY